MRLSKTVYKLLWFVKSNCIYSALGKLCCKDFESQRMRYDALDVHAEGEIHRELGEIFFKGLNT